MRGSGRSRGVWTPAPGEVGVEWAVERVSRPHTLVEEQLALESQRRQAALGSHPSKWWREEPAN